MDLKNHTTTTVVVTADSPDTDDVETPLHSQLVIKPFSDVKNHHHQPPSTVVVAYKECLKNHAASIGSHALDGCGEYMTSPGSLKCAVCGCHRNFHRREPINNVYACAPHVMLSLTQNDHHHHHHQINHVVASPRTPAAIKIEHPNNGRKRFRTRFSQDQKEKMSDFAEKLGWKMQRCDDKKVVDFCDEIGIRRGIFKVWMHNNKNTLGKKDKDLTIISPTTAAGANISGGVVDQSHEEDVIDVNGGDHNNNNNNSSDDQENGGHDHVQVSTNRSSCSC
ncbi:zinc-finger homeodomain protein 11-like [Rutidosis leptorrhynchoides]|uniref:zinc-finger homeodomain protein 11-like n=1 Tax=Rutidosis leptorrhynchoides TaxID=125765 RepID=UPI003A98E59C